MEWRRKKRHQKKRRRGKRGGRRFSPITKSVREESRGSSPSVKGAAQDTLWQTTGIVTPAGGAASPDTNPKGRENRPRLLHPASCLNKGWGHAPYRDH